MKQVTLLKGRREIINILISFIWALIDFLRDLWLWLLLGFLLAGFVQEFLPIEYFLKYLGRNSPSSIAKMCLVGFATSMCTCGAIPLTITLRRKGATTANALTFLLSSPWMGFLHLLILVNLIGLKAASYFFVFSIFVAFLTGITLGYLEERKKIEQRISEEEISGLEAEEREHREEKRSKRMICALERSWDLFTDIGKYLLIGFVAAALVKAFIPEEAVQQYLGLQSRFFDPILFIIPISAVIELCSEGFSILGGQLYRMGASPGVIFTMIMVGVSTDFTEISVILGKFGKKTAIAYIAVSTALVVVFAHLMNWIWT